jgi:hypothetical protein
MFAGLSCGHRHSLMLIVGNRDRDHVDAIVFDQGHPVARPAIDSVGSGRALGSLGDHIGDDRHFRGATIAAEIRTKGTHRDDMSFGDTATADNTNPYLTHRAPGRL